jgi:hypothetical protein
MPKPIPGADPNERRRQICRLNPALADINYSERVRVFARELDRECQHNSGDFVVIRREVAEEAVLAMQEFYRTITGYEPRE